MTLFSKSTIAALACVAAVSSASAADLITYPTSTAEAIPVMDNAGFDWNRFYAGISGVVQDYDTPVPGYDWEYGLGVQMGINQQFDFALLGGELAIMGMGNSTHGRTYAQATVRAGVIVTDEVALYATGGYGVDLSGASDQHWLLGGGAEFAVTDNVSLRAQYLHGFPTSAAYSPMNQVSVGVNYHF